MSMTEAPKKQSVIPTPAHKLWRIGFDPFAASMTFVPIFTRALFAKLETLVI